VSFLVLLAVLGGLAYRGTSPEERERYLAIAMRFVRRLKVAITEPGPEHESFRDALRARTSHALITPAIVLFSATIVGGMLFGASAIGDPDTLVAWGASLGTRTTNGEWWRLVTSTFVHTGTLHLLVDIAVLIQVGGILERLIGRLTFTAVYISAGAFAGLVNLSSHPVTVSVGAPGAIFGLYGLLLASLFWQIFWQIVQRDNPEPEAEEGAEPRVTIPPTTMKRLGVGAAVFIVFSALSGLVHAAEFTGLLVGMMYGLVFARRVSEKQPGTRHVAFAMVATGAIAVAGAMAHRNITDIKPEIARVLATEERTAAAYQTGFDALKRGRMSAEALAQLAERTIVPELQASDMRLETLTNVPPEHQPLVADAREYLRLRCTSWRARANAIRRIYADPPRAPAGAASTSSRLQAEARFRSNMAARGTAESAERASLEAFQRIKPATPPGQVIAGKAQ
jgi:membrane associated rhomboid family serine protease